MADIITGLVVFVLISVVQGGEWCTDHSTDWFDSSDTFWCDQGCCGNYNNRHCCLSGTAGTVVGIVIGSLVFVGLVISAIIAICCCLKRNRGRQGQVVTGQRAGTTVQMTTVQQPYMQQPYGQQPYLQQPYMQQPYMQQPYMQQPGQGPYPNMPQPGQGPNPSMPYTQPGNPNQGFEPPKYSEAVNPPKYNDVVNPQ